MRVIIAATVAGAIALQPVLAAAAPHTEDDDDEIVQDSSSSSVREQETLPNGPLLATALLTFGGGYIPAIVAGAASTRVEDRYLFLPIAGPWVDLGARERCAAWGTPCNTEDTERALLIAMGVAQGVGTLLFALSMVVPEVRVPEESARVRVVPSVGRESASLNVLGTF